MLLSLALLLAACNGDPVDDSDSGIDTEVDPDGDTDGDTSVEPLPECGDGVVDPVQICIPRATGVLSGPTVIVAHGEFREAGALDAAVISTQNPDIVERWNAYPSTTHSTFDSDDILFAVGWGDLDGDGDTDLVALGEAQIHSWLNNGEGQLSEGPSANHGHGYADLHRLVVLESDDGAEVVSCASFTGSCFRWSTDAAANFTALSPLNIQFEAGDAIAADVDDDGDEDVIVGHNYPGAIGLDLFIAGDDGELTRTELSPGRTARQPKVLDFDSDGHTDLLFHDNTHVYAMYGSEDGLGDPIQLDNASWNRPIYSWELLDIDGEGRLDIALTSDQLYAALWTESGFGTPSSQGISAGYGQHLVQTNSTYLSYTQDGRMFWVATGDTWELRADLPLSYPVGEYLTDVLLVDVDGDDLLDAVASDYYGQRGWWLPMQDDGSFGNASALFADDGDVHSMATADLNDDDSPDFVVAKTNTSAVSVWLSNALGGYDDAGDTAVGPGPSRVALGDLNEDGLLDFVTANVGEGAGVSGGAQDTISVRLGSGNGQFSAPTTPELATCGSPERVLLDDIDGDGHLDAAVSCLDGGIDIRLGDGTGNLVANEALFIDAPIVRESALADLNGDGRLDIAYTAGEMESRSVYVAVGHATGWTTTYFAVVPSNAYSVAFGTIDGDDDLDLVVSSTAAPHVFLGSGDGHFSNTPFAVPGGATELAVGDLEGDGVDDIVSVAAGRVILVKNNP